MQGWGVCVCVCVCFLVGGVGLVCRRVGVEVGVVCVVFVIEHWYGKFCRGWLFCFVLGYIYVYIYI